ncbi:MAG: copper resistance protein NlpE N-terminal domain-containing protein [Bacteroidota bacterium]
MKIKIGLKNNNTTKNLILNSDSSFRFEGLRMTSLSFFSLLITLFLGCGSSKPDFPTPDKAITWLIYEGTLPCNDCSEIKTQLELKISTDGTTSPFIIKQAFIETKEGDQAVIDHGQYSLLKGTYREKDAVIYNLQFNKENKRTYFLRITEDTLLMLDQAMKEIVSDQNYKLILTGKKEE